MSFGVGRGQVVTLVELLLGELVHGSEDWLLKERCDKWHLLRAHFGLLFNGDMLRELLDSTFDDGL